MKKGLVLGKFMPLHLGHIAMIRFALEHCDSLIVMLCVSSKEQISGELRKQWLKDTFDHDSRIHIALVEYDEDQLPNSSVSSRHISSLWADYIRVAFPGIDLFVSSEPYGEFVAEFLGIVHHSFDPDRKQVPVAASAILQQPFVYWDYIAPAARSYFVKKICISGSESTGKSTLAEKLAEHFQTAFVPEMAREVIEETENVVFDDLFAIASLHAKTIDEKVTQANRLLFVDTDVNITKSYSRFLFDKELTVEPWIDAANEFDLHLFLQTDCPYVQDGTRLGEADRHALSDYHMQQLLLAGAQFVEVGGSWQQRFEQAKAIVTKRFLK